MSDYSNEAIFIYNKNTNQETVLITSKNEHQSDQHWKANVPFSFGPEYMYLRRILVRDGLTKEQAIAGRRALMTYYETSGMQFQNTRETPIPIKIQD
jgi:hypothetical protein